MNQHIDSIDEEIENDKITDQFYRNPQLLVADRYFDNQIIRQRIQLFKHTIGVDTEVQNKRRRINKIKYQAQTAYDTIHRIHHAHNYIKSIWLSKDHNSENVISNTTIYNYKYRPVPDTATLIFHEVQYDQELYRGRISPPRHPEEGHLRVIIFFWTPNTHSCFAIAPKFFRPFEDSGSNSSVDSDFDPFDSSDSEDISIDPSDSGYITDIEDNNSEL